MKAYHGTFVSTDVVMEEISKIKTKYIGKYSPNAYTAEQLTPEGKAVYDAMMELYNRIWQAGNESERI